MNTHNGRCLAKPQVWICLFPCTHTHTHTGNCLSLTSGPEVCLSDCPSLLRLCSSPLLLQFNLKVLYTLNSQNPDSAKQRDRGIRHLAGLGSVRRLFLIFTLTLSWRAVGFMEKWVRTKMNNSQSAVIKQIPEKFWTASPLTLNLIMCLKYCVCIFY